MIFDIARNLEKSFIFDMAVEIIPTFRPEFTFSLTPCEMRNVNSRMLVLITDDTTYYNQVVGSTLSLTYFDNS